MHTLASMRPGDLAACGPSFRRVRTPTVNCLGGKELTGFVPWAFSVLDLGLAGGTEAETAATDIADGVPCTAVRVHQSIVRPSTGEGVLEALSERSAVGPKSDPGQKRA